MIRTVYLYALLFLSGNIFCQNTYFKKTSEYLPGDPTAVSISAKDDGSGLIAVSRDGSIKKFDPRTKLWNGHNLTQKSRSGLISAVKARKVEYVGQGYLVLDKRNYTHLVINEKIVNSYGYAVDITGGGTLWFRITKDGKIEQFDGNLDGAWTDMAVQPPVEAKTIEASRWNNPWITTGNGDIYRYVGRSKTWVKVDGKASELFISKKDEVYMISRAQLVGGGGILSKYIEKSKSWEGGLGYAKSIAPYRSTNTYFLIDIRGRVVQNEEKEVAYNLNEKTIDGIAARSVFHSNKGDLAGIDKNGSLYFYEYNPPTWTPIKLKNEINQTFKAVDVALGNRAMYHVLDDQSQIWRIFATQVNKEPLKAIDLTMGQDNRTYIIGTDRKIYYKDGILKDWVKWAYPPPIKPVKIAVSRYKNPWIIGDDRSIYRFVGRSNKWQKVEGTASDLMITPSDEVYKLSVANLVGGGSAVGKYDGKEKKWNYRFGYARSITPGNEKNDFIIADIHHRVKYKTGWILEDYCPDKSFCDQLFNELFDVKVRSYIPPRFTMLGNSSSMNMVSVIDNDYLNKGCRYSTHLLKQAIENNKSFDEVFMDLLVAWSDQWGGGVSFAKDWVASQVADGVCDLVDGGNDCKRAVSATTLLAIDAALIYIGLPPNLPDARQLREDGIEYVASEVASYAVLNANNAVGEYIPPELRAEVMKIAYDITEAELTKKLDEYIPTFNTDTEDPSTWGIPADIYAPHNAKLYLEIKIKNRDIYESVLGMDYHSWPTLTISDNGLIYQPIRDLHFPSYLPEDRITIPLELAPFTTAVSSSDRVPNSIPGIAVSRDWVVNKFGAGYNFDNIGQQNIHLDRQSGEWSDWDLFYYKANETTFKITANFNTTSGSTTRLQTRKLDDVKLNVAWVWDQKTGIGVLEGKRVNNKDVKVLKNYYGRLNPPPRCDGKQNIRWVRY